MTIKRPSLSPSNGQPPSHKSTSFDATAHTTLYPSYILRFPSLFLPRSIHSNLLLHLKPHQDPFISMADEWWSGSQRSHGTSACSAAPLMDTGHAATCGWTSPAAESTSSTTFQDPHRSSSTITHQPSSDAASSIGDAHMDWTHAFL